MTSLEWHQDFVKDTDAGDRAEEHDEAEDDSDDSDDSDNPNSATYDNTLGCCFPDRCLMPGEHLRAECYTVEMAEAWDREAQDAAERGGR